MAPVGAIEREPVSPEPAADERRGPPSPGRPESARLRLGDGRTTTLHVVRYPSASTRVRVVHLDPPERLEAWCDGAGVADAMIGGFFVRSEGRPLGELRIGGRPAAHVPFAEPWDLVRSCVHSSADGMALAGRGDLPAEPEGDLLQAGPMLVAEGRSLIGRLADPEGFSAGSHQFDSDITEGRHPRAALGTGGEEVIAVVCDGRAVEDSGLTIGELAATMLLLGAERAINLDGGGSASLVSGGRLRNSPREEHGIPLRGGRPISTALTFTPR